jgi:hypothetical protein
MNKSKKVCLPNALILVMDPTTDDIPKTLGQGIIASTKSCVAVGATSDVDGETEITLGNMNDVSPEAHLLFEGQLNTEENRIAVMSPYREVLLEMAAKNKIVSVRIWVNGMIAPDRIVVGIE